METEDKYARRLEELQNQLRRQKAAVEEIGWLLNQSARGLFQRDQAAYLEELKSRIMQVVELVQADEIEAENEFNKGMMASRIPSTMMDLYHAFSGRRNSSEKGLTELLAEIYKKPPFHMILIAIGPEGIPEDVKVMSISLDARNSNVSEKTAAENLRNYGFLLLTPQIFTALIVNLKKKVLDGSVSLPFGIEHISQELSVKADKRDSTMR